MDQLESKEDFVLDKQNLTHVGTNISAKSNCFFPFQWRMYEEMIIIF